MTKTCASDYPNNEIHVKIRNMCQTNNTQLLDDDFLLSSPVTAAGLWLNKTYRNLFCAVCNYESKISVWNLLAVRCENSGSVDSQNSSSIDNAQLIANNLRVEMDKNRKILISNVNSSITNCHIYGYGRNNSMKPVDFCNSACSLYEDISSVCEARSNVGQPSSAILESSTSILYDVIKWTLLVLSTLLLVLFFLIMMAHPKRLKNITNRVLLSLAITLFANYVMYEIVMKVMSCKPINSIISHYLFLSYHTWVFLVAQNGWRVICLKRKTYNTAGNYLYILYCCIGWGLPWFVILLGLYLDSDEKRSDDWKPRYGLTSSCFIEGKEALIYLCHYPLSILYSLMLTLFVPTFYKIYSVMRTNAVFPTQKKYFLFFMKYASIAGLLGAWNMYFMLTDDKFIETRYLAYISPHGLCLYFAHGFRKDTLRSTFETIRNRWFKK